MKSTEYLKRILAGLSVAVLLAGCTAGSTTARTYHCSLTGKDFAQCCCVKKEGKLYCTEAQKFVDQCCCINMDHTM